MNRLLSHISQKVFKGLLYPSLILFFFSSTIEAKGTIAQQVPEQVKWQGSFEDENLQALMKSYLGIRYVYGGSTIKGFDCSGFVKEIYGKYFSIDLPHQSSQQSRYPELTPVSIDALRTGDLIFFSMSGKKKRINHVGIYLSDGEFIHAGRSTGIVISSLKTSYWRTRVVSSKRLSDREKYRPGDFFIGMEWVINSEDVNFSLLNDERFHNLSGSGLVNHTGYSDIINIYNTMEFGFTRQSPSSLTSFSYFRSAFLYDRDMPDGAHYMDYAGIRDEIRPDYTQGVKISGSFNVHNNISIIPSLSYFDYSSEIERNNLPRLALDLNYRLFSSSDKWSMTGGLHMPLQKYPLPGHVEDISDNGIGLSLTYQQKLTDNMSFSISGRNFSDSFQEFMQYPSSSGSNKEDRNFNFRFKINY
ncbi:MAG: C40 family peptidase [Deltaproteobacteria bacterium]|nr:C40 family peptidase [Deltaproteobacteria bacterium]